VIQSESLNEIRSYLIRLNNEHRAMKKIKDKEFMNKVRTSKQVISAEKLSKTFYKKIKATKSVNLSNSRDAILTSVKDTDLQDENCFICHKLDHISRECSNQVTRVTAVKDNDDDEFNRSTSVSESDFDSKN
jgi:hypothetical protein